MRDAETKLFCLLGKPVSHSLSPAMHNAGFNALGLNAVYLAFEPENLGNAVKGLKELGIKGFNATMPFKVDILKHLDLVDPIAKKIGAVNTVVNTNGVLKGYNTDGIGAVQSLKAVTQLHEKKVLLLGAGGAGKAIAFYLREENAKVTVADRDSAKASKLALLAGAKSVALNGIKTLEGFDIVINASPSGMKPNTHEMPIIVPASLLRKEIIVFDIVYDPIKTRFLREAELRGCRTINGVEMLLNQGYAAFKLFTGKEAPKREMRKAVMENLK